MSLQKIKDYASNVKLSTWLFIAAVFVAAIFMQPGFGALIGLLIISALIYSGAYLLEHSVPINEIDELF